MQKIKLAQSFDVDYWTARLTSSRHYLNATRSTTKISIESMSMTVDDFRKTSKGEALLLQEKALETEQEMFQRQLKRMQDASPDFNLQQAFTTLFISAPTGLGLGNPKGQRDNTLQSRLRADLIEKMHSRVRENSRTLWCPISGMEWHEGSTRAGHLFPHKCGENLMDAIFGKIRDQNGNSELFKAQNGILWSSDAEE